MSHDPRNLNLTAAELAAIEEHKYFLSLERGAEVSIEEAIEDFARRFAREWRREKTRHDLGTQRAEIRKFQEQLAADNPPGFDPSLAAAQWCERFAGPWRAERESMERNGLRRLKLNVRSLSGGPALSWGEIAGVVAHHDCAIYVHAPVMPVWHFLLEGRRFISLKSTAGSVLPAPGPGEPLEFIATGAQAQEALAELQRAAGEPG